MSTAKGISTLFSIKLQVDIRKEFRNDRFAVLKKMATILH